LLGADKAAHPRVHRGIGAHTVRTTGGQKNSGGMPCDRDDEACGSRLLFIESD
jgi:hypothetical protein